LVPEELCLRTAVDQASRQFQGPKPIRLLEACHSCLKGKKAEDQDRTELSRKEASLRSSE